MAAALFGPLLSYLADVLPPPLYSLFINLVSHCLAFITALLTLLSSLISTHPSNWDAQKLLPPVITLLAAYLALLAFYRTTSWIFRTTIWFIKWGTILGVLAAGAGWFAGHTVSDLGANVALEKIGRSFFALDNSRSGSQRTNPRSSRKQPKSWESFQRHREWRIQQQHEGSAEDSEAHEVVNNIISAASKVLKESGWWGMAIERMSEGSSEKAGKPDEPLRKSKAGTSRSR